MLPPFRVERGATSNSWEGDTSLDSSGGADRVLLVVVGFDSLGLFFDPFRPPSSSLIEVAVAMLEVVPF